MRERNYVSWYRGPVVVAKDGEVPDAIVQREEEYCVNEVNPSYLCGE